MFGPLSPATPLLVLLLVALTAAPLWIPGALLLAHLQPRLRLPTPLLPLAAIAGSGLFGYAVFWCYFWSPAVGRAASFGLLAASALALVLPVGRRRLRALATGELRVVWIAIACSAFAATNLHLGVVRDPVGPHWSWAGHAVSSRLFIAPDNQIPLVFAQRLFEGAELRARIFRDQASERPPLQTGIVLIQYPLWRGLAALGAARALTDACYQVLGTLLQLTWMAAAWALLRLLGFGRRASGGVLLALVPSYFLYLNSVYVWPKLLAGGLVVGAYCLLLQRPSGAPLPPARMGVAAGLAALGLLAHAGVATSLLGFGLVLLLPRWFPGAANLARGALVGVALLAPWLAYQRLYDPPANFLLKNHLAGVLQEDDRSTLQALRDSYAGFTPRSYLELKLRTLRMVLGIDRQQVPIYDLPSALRSLRRYQTNQLVPALGVLNLGWPVVLFVLWRGPPEPRARWRGLARGLGVGLLCTGVWMMVQLSLPALQHASYATLILLFVALAAALVSLPPALCVPLLALNAALSVAVALSFPVTRSYSPAPLVAAALGYAALALVCLCGSGSAPEPRAGEEIAA